MSNLLTACCQKCGSSSGHTMRTWPAASISATISQTSAKNQNPRAPTRTQSKQWQCLKVPPSSTQLSSARGSQLNLSPTNHKIQNTTTTADRLALSGPPLELLCLLSAYSSVLCQHRPHTTQQMPHTFPNCNATHCGFFFFFFCLLPELGFVFGLGRK